MSVHNTHAIKVNCDGYGCRESALVEGSVASDLLPDGWYELDGGFAQRKVFHQPPCLIGFMTAMTVVRQDGNGKTIGSADAHLDLWAAVKREAAVASLRRDERGRFLPAVQ